MKHSPSLSHHSLPLLPGSRAHCSCRRDVLLLLGVNILLRPGHCIPLGRLCLLLRGRRGNLFLRRLFQSGQILRPIQYFHPEMLPAIRMNSSVPMVGQHQGGKEPPADLPSWRPPHHAEERRAVTASRERSDSIQDVLTIHMNVKIRPLVLLLQHGLQQILPLPDVSKQFSVALAQLLVCGHLLELLANDFLVGTLGGEEALLNVIFLRVGLGPRGPSSGLVSESVVVGPIMVQRARGIVAVALMVRIVEEAVLGTVALQIAIVRTGAQLFSQQHGFVLSLRNRSTQGLLKNPHVLRKTKAPGNKARVGVPVN
mmetsp:Transcript_56368/g.123515  ORF Transcript_56368/g.123515 Transcript_56368/m.123515 type:complete len:313 (+) Transcript_56368:149-1087(+)